MTHASISPEERNKIGLSDSLIRMSVGIEHPDDLIEDLDQAFEKLNK
jgi:cystathionine beta-lyase/cystathionine gamma-synthase